MLLVDRVAVVQQAGARVEVNASDLETSFKLAQTDLYRDGGADLNEPLLLLSYYLLPELAKKLRTVVKKALQQEKAIHELHELHEITRSRIHRRKLHG